MIFTRESLRVEQATLGARIVCWYSHIHQRPQRRHQPLRAGSEAGSLIVIVVVFINANTIIVIIVITIIVVIDRIRKIFIQVDICTSESRRAATNRGNDSNETLTDRYTLLSYTTLRNKYLIGSKAGNGRSIRRTRNCRCCSMGARRSRRLEADEADPKDERSPC